MSQFYCKRKIITTKLIISVFQTFQLTVSKQEVFKTEKRKTRAFSGYCGERDKRGGECGGIRVPEMTLEERKKKKKRGRESREGG